MARQAEPLEFQSTLPAGGATPIQLAVALSEFISIHTPRRGSDFQYRIQFHLLNDFNPHSPQGERPKYWRASMSKSNFNPHSPQGERPNSLSVDSLFALISIHTPRRGSDLVHRQELCDQIHFNPHSPQGERPPNRRHTLPPGHFNPHSPQGERLSPPSFSGLDTLFQSTLPAGGATLCVRLTRRSIGFQSTLPAGGAT